MTATLVFLPFADHYENVYCMVRGWKVFTLLPPSDVYRMHLRHYHAAKYTCIDGELHPVIHQPLQHVSWSPINPNPATAEERLQAARDYPHFFDSSLPKPIRVVLGPGETLYLPAMWYHHVAQVPGESRAAAACQQEFG